MSDYFRFYCDGLDEPRLLYAMHKSPHVLLIWLWVLCECARTKRNQIEQPSNSMIVGLQHKLNVPPDSILICLRLLTEIEYLAFESGYYIVRKWNDLQSKYMQEKAWRETHKHQKKPKETKNPIGEERRGEEKREDKEEDTLFALLTTRLGKLFNRRETTAWNDKEKRALKCLAKRFDFADEVRRIESYFELMRKDGRAKFLRHDLITLLNNWTGELDRAANFRPEVMKNAKQAAIEQRNAARDRLVSDYQKQIVTMTEEEAHKFMEKVRDNLKDVVAECWVFDAWVAAQKGSESAKTDDK